MLKPPTTAQCWRGRGSSKILKIPWGGNYSLDLPVLEQPDPQILPIVSYDGQTTAFKTATPPTTTSVWSLLASLKPTRIRPLALVRGMHF